MRPLRPDSYAPVLEKETWISAMLDAQNLDYTSSNSAIERGLTAHLLTDEIGRDMAEFLVDLHWRASKGESLLPEERELLKAPSGSTARHQKSQAEKRDAALQVRAEVNRAKAAVQLADEDLVWQRSHLNNVDSVERMDFDSFMAAQRTTSRHLCFTRAMEFVRDASVARETIKFITDVIVPGAHRRKLEAEKALSALLKEAA